MKINKIVYILYVYIYIYIYIYYCNVYKYNEVIKIYMLIKVL